MRATIHCRRALPAIAVVLAVSGPTKDATAQRRVTGGATAISVVPSGPAPTNFQITELVGNKVAVRWDPTPGARLYYVKTWRSANDPNPTTRSVTESFFIDNVQLPPNFTVIYEILTDNPTKGPGRATVSYRTRDVHPWDFLARYDGASKRVLFQWKDPDLPVPIKNMYLAGANGAPSFTMPPTQMHWWATLPPGTYTYTLLMYFDAPGGVHESNHETAPRVIVTVP